MPAPGHGGRYPRILGAQVTLFESQTYEDLGRSLDRMRAAGVNTLFFRVFKNRGDRSHGFIRGQAAVGVYFKTTRAPVVEDVLGRVCDLAHARGIRVFAWMTTRASDWLTEERPGLAGWMLDPEKGKLVRTPGLDLFRPQVVEYLKGIFVDLAGYPIDGVLFQDDLVLRHTEGFGPEAEKLYRQDFGRALAPSALFQRRGGRISYRPEFWSWASWKNRRILEVVDSIVEEVSAIRPDLYWALNGYYESVTAPRNALAWYAQDLKEALSHRVDYLAVMAYHRQIMEELHISYGETLDLVTRMTRDAILMAGGPDRVLIKIQALDWNTELPLPAGELRQFLDAVLAGGSPGLVYVRGRNPPPLAPMGKAFSRFSKRREIY